MAVYVKPNGLLGTALHGRDQAFRHLIVYPPAMREFGRNRRARAGDPTPTHA